MSDEPLHSTLHDLIDRANAGVTHEEFVAGVHAGTMGFRCVTGEPYRFVHGGRLYLFYLFVTLYFFVPWVVVPLWAWHENNWWLLFGILASIAGVVAATRLHRQKAKQESVAALLAVALAATWFVRGGHDIWTFYLGAATWSFVLWMIAEQSQWDYALQCLVERSDTFERAVEQRSIMVVRAS